MTTRPSATSSTFTKLACFGPQPAMAAARRYPARRFLMAPLVCAARATGAGGDMNWFPAKRTGHGRGLRRLLFSKPGGPPAVSRRPRRRGARVDVGDCRARLRRRLRPAVLELLEAPRPVILEEAGQRAVGEQ